MKGRELHHFGVRVCIIEPDAFATPITSNLEEKLRDIWKRVPSDIKEAFGEDYFERCWKVHKFIFNYGDKNLCLVTNCIEHGLTSSYPRTRYVVGRLSVPMVVLASLPSGIADRMITWSYPKPAQAI